MYQFSDSGLSDGSESLGFLKYYYNSGVIFCFYQCFDFSKLPLELGKGAEEVVPEAVESDGSWL